MPTTPTADELSELPLDALARLIRADWGPNQSRTSYAWPYLEAMLEGGPITADANLRAERFYMDDFDGIVRYFLSNASSYRGPVARAVKVELKRRLKR